MRNPIAIAKDHVESKVKTSVKTHFVENKQTYIACASTAAVVAAVVSRTHRPVINVTVNVTTP